MSDAPIATPTGDTPRPTDDHTSASGAHPRPNYAARRMLVTTILITALVAAGVVGWRFTRGDDDTPSGPGGDWDEIALIDRTTGAVTLVDEQGESVSSAIGLGRVVDVHEHGDRLALVGVDQLVLQSPDSEPVVVPIGRGVTVTPIRTDDTFHLATGRASGGNVTIIDANDGSVTDIGELVSDTLPSAPLMFVDTLRWNADASMFAIADAATGQTFVVGDDLDGAVFLRDQPVAVGEELVATSQIIGRQADVALLDLEGRTEANAATGIPAGGVMTDDRLLMVSIDGEVMHLERGATEATRLAAVSVPSGATVRAVHPVADGQRLLVDGAAFAAVIDLEGRTVFTTTFTAPVDVAPPDPSWSCLPVGGGEIYHSLIDLDSGEQLANLTGLAVTGVAGDGCTVIGERDGITELVTAAGTVTLGQPRDAVLGPDGRTVVFTTAAGITELRRIDDELELGEPTVLDAPSNLAVAFIDR